MPTYGGATSNSKVTVSHEGARSALRMQAHCAESAAARLCTSGSALPPTGTLEERAWHIYR
jgi:hypothetical protein